jgi:hypothetical protein
MRAHTGLSESAIEQRSGHKLFIEGNDESFDRTVMGELLGELGVAVRPLGPCRHIKAAAQALHAQEPTYYFLIDRDYHDEAEVERSWQNFPDPKTHNLLIWRKRELENYFLDPPYLAASPWLLPGTSVETLQELIVARAQARIYLEAANLVLVALREDQKRSPVEELTGPEQFPSEAAAVAGLIGHVALHARPAVLAQELAESRLRERLGQVLDRLFGDREHQQLRWGVGTWVDEVSGKQLFRAVVNRYFHVKDQRGQRLLGKDVVQGTDPEKSVVKSLLARPLAEQPRDFQALVGLLTARLRSTT